MAEWLKAHAWKACIRQRIEGSNPFLSARVYPTIKSMCFNNKDRGLKKVFVLIIGTEIDVVYTEYDTLYFSK